MSLAVGIVYDKNGAPKIDPGFIENLTAIDRERVRENLNQHGYRLTDQNTVEKQ